MNVSEYSLIMAVCWSNVLILLAYFFRRQLWFARVFGLNSLLLLYGGFVLRLCAVFEFEATIEIQVPQMNFIGELLEWSLPLGTSQIPAATLLVTVWLSVSTVRIFHIAWNYRRDLRNRSFMTAAGPEVERCLAKVIDRRHIGKIRAVVSEVINSPCIAGICHGIICLPKCDLKAKELEVICRHEYAHFRHRDTLIHLLVEMFCAAFWWNPCCYLLKRCQNEILEFRADQEAVKGLKPSDARYYCLTLINFSGSESVIASYFASSKLERRVVRILDKPIPHKRKILCTAILFLFAVILLALSFCVIPQPYFIADCGKLVLDGKCVIPPEFTQNKGDVTLTENELSNLKNLIKID